MPREPGPAYDSFVVRLWHEASSGHLLRAEVEHLQTGAVHVGRGIVPSWLLDTFRACARILPLASKTGDVEDTTGKERDDDSDAPG